MGQNVSLLRRLRRRSPSDSDENCECINNIKTCDFHKCTCKDDPSTCKGRVNNMRQAHGGLHRANHICTCNGDPSNCRYHIINSSYSHMCICEKGGDYLKICRASNRNHRCTCNNNCTTCKCDKNHKCICRKGKRYSKICQAPNKKHGCMCKSKYNKKCRAMDSCKYIDYSSSSS